MNPAKMGPRGLEMLKDFEKCHLTSYLDQAGVWTIGWGHTGPEVGPKQKITQKKADALLAADLAKAEAEVLRRVRRPLTQLQFDALVSFEYNSGGLFFGSPGRESKVLKAINRGDDENVDDLLMEWVQVADVANPGKKIKSAGLVRRRQAEAALWIEGTTAAPNEAYTQYTEGNVAPAKIEPTAVTSDRTVQATAGVGIAAALSEAAQQISAFAEHSNIIRAIFVALIVAGVCYAAYEVKRRG